jgi:hypothetical protein
MWIGKRVFTTEGAGDAEEERDKGFEILNLKPAFSHSIISFLCDLCVLCV